MTTETPTQQRGKASNGVGGRPANRLERTTFRTSRLLEFCSEKELVAQTGHPVERWPLVILKELVDNALDAAEEADIAPAISITVSNGKVTVTDNGSGIPAETVAAVLDYSVRVSSREAYVSPTRGAQGNALKTILAMGFALTGTEAETIIESRGVRHRIKFAADQIRQEPRITHTRTASSVKTGTRITVHWPDSACSILGAAKSRFLQIAEDYTWLNPHLTLQIKWDRQQRMIAASDPGWSKWKPDDPLSPHWYTPDRLERHAAAYVADDQDHGRPRTVRALVSEFRGLSGTAKQMAVLEATGMSRTALSDLFHNGEPDRDRIGKLLAAMQAHSKPVKPVALGIIGRDHLAARFEAAGADLQTFQYKRVLRDDDGMPAVIEIAFGYCPNGEEERRIITGANWSVGIVNPFRSLGGQSLDTLLSQQRADRDEPIVLVVHLACPLIQYTDRGKSAIALRQNPEFDSDYDDEEADE
jgi:DNA topoisomerase VI subunit B